MKTLLITAFEPFGGRETNDSLLTLDLLPDKIGDYRVVRKLLPVVFGDAPALAIAAAEEAHADAVLALGEAGGREKVTVEQIGINLRRARVADNAGNAPDCPCVPGGPDGIFSTLPVQAMVAAMENAGVPAAVSYTAGTYLCNDVLYSLLHRFSGTPVRCGFIHVPVGGDNAANAKAIAAAIEVI